MRLHELDGRKVGVWGAGEEGRSAVQALRRFAPAADVVVLAETAPDDSSWLHDIELRIGDDGKALNDRDVIIRSPGISRYRPDVRALRDKRVEQTTGTALWFAETEGRNAIAVTGTKGKSTTSSLIAHLLHGLGRDARLAGNIGRPLLNLLGESDAHTWVLELSSYQTSELSHSPDIGLLTSLSPEHLNWHNDDAATYYADKLNLFRHRDDMTSVVNMADSQSAAVSNELPNVVGYGISSGVHVRDGAYFSVGERLFDAGVSQLPGPHNQLNVSGALAALQSRGVDIVEHAHDLERVLGTFAPLAHRLEPIAEINGVTYVDDGLATTPEASIAALEAYPDVPVALILGGFDRALPYDRLATTIADRTLPTAVLTIPDNGPRVGTSVREAARGKTLVDVIDCESLEAAVREAHRWSGTGGIVLLSPGAPSFGVFTNYRERSARFREVVSAL